MDKSEPVIVTFYSYKGGVGRSMAIANVACILAEKYGKRVLMVDWDLEAPGLHRFFGLEPKKLKPGLIDILEDYKALLTDDKLTELPEQLVNIDSYIHTRGMPSYKSGGSVALISAGRQDERYAGRVNEFSWGEFYKKWHGYGFIEYLKGEFKKKAEIVLLDSRTGVTDIGGICTLQLPDVVVLMFALNEQNISGVETIARSIRERATEVAKREKPPALVVRPARVEIYLEEKRLKDCQKDAADRLGQYVTGEDEPLRYMAKRAIPYIGAYSFGEIPLAVESNKFGPLAEAYESLTKSVLKAAGLAEPSESDGGQRPSAKRLLAAGLRNIRQGFSALLKSRVAAVALLVAVVSLSVFVERNRSERATLQRSASDLEKAASDYKVQASVSEARLNDSEKRLKEAEAMKAELDFRMARNRPVNLVPTPDVQYCTDDDAERQKVESALRDLHWPVAVKPAVVKGVPVNSIYFGSQVDPEDAKSVASSLIRAGIEVKGIYRFKNSSGTYYGKPKKTLIQIVATQFDGELPALTEQDVLNTTEFRTYTR